MCQEIALPNISIFKHFHFNFEKDCRDHESKEQRDVLALTHSASLVTAGSYKVAANMG